MRGSEAHLVSYTQEAPRPASDVARPAASQPRQLQRPRTQHLSLPCRRAVGIYAGHYERRRAPGAGPPLKRDPDPRCRRRARHTRWGRPVSD
jgi:hypothetical protein